MENKIKRLKNKKICFLGLGIENLSLAKFLLSKNLNAEFVIADSLSGKELRYRLYEIEELAKNNEVKPEIRAGKGYDKNLTDFDIIFRSPGYPLFSNEIKKAGEKGVEVNSPMKFFFEIAPTKNIIGVTGTKGKGTISSLVYNILKKGGKDVWLGGNIGIPPLNFLTELKKDSWVVLEMSSFQLEDMEVSPKIGVICNLYKEHLRTSDPNNPNYHKKLKDYWGAKMNIFKYQKKGDKAIINEKFKYIALKYDFNSKLITFGKSDLKSKLYGEHNKENIAAAVAVAEAVKIPNETISKAVKNYKSLEHRIELVLEDKEKVKYFNDSFATTSESTITALEAFESPIILLAGGADKGSDFKELAKKIKEKVKYLILFSGEATPRLKKEAIKAGLSPKNIKTAYSMKEAVELARKNKEFGDIVLMSTACASFGLFKNYKERGELFKKEVEKIK